MIDNSIYFFFHSSLVISSQCLPWWMPNTHVPKAMINTNVMSI